MAVLLHKTGFKKAQLYHFKALLCIVKQGSLCYNDHSGQVRAATAAEIHPVNLQGDQIMAYEVTFKFAPGEWFPYQDRDVLLRVQQEDMYAKQGKNFENPEFEAMISQFHEICRDHATFDAELDKALEK